MALWKASAGYLAFMRSSMLAYELTISSGDMAVAVTLGRDTTASSHALSRSSWCSSSSAEGANCGRIAGSTRQKRSAKGAHASSAIAKSFRKKGPSASAYARRKASADFIPATRACCASASASEPSSARSKAMYESALLKRSTKRRAAARCCALSSAILGQRSSRYSLITRLSVSGGVPSRCSRTGTLARASVGCGSVATASEYTEVKFAGLFCRSTVTRS
mmetsp:Transcript_28087/g.71343  ORF Transcript_28087/g.71343 Transcript_28087/m.71343 type:complete len:221 (-) Transcript_28087:217-879(-)